MSNAQNLQKSLYLAKHLCCVHVFTVRIVLREDTMMETIGLRTTYKQTLVHRIFETIFCEKMFGRDCLHYLYN